AMARAVAEALNAGQHLLVEAGTGVGKSLAYLAPAAFYALHNGARIVISTDTINLQEQLMGKDIPVLQGLLSAKGMGPLLAVHLKGRRNYLCLRRFEEARRNGPQGQEEARFLARLILWECQTTAGDRGELNLPEVQEPMWTRLSAQSEECLAGPCRYVADGSCYLFRSRRRAESAHLVIVNHALLLADLALGGRLIPPYDHIIVDEAHNLEEEATRQLGIEVRDDDLGISLDRLHRPGRAAGPGGPGTRGGGLVGSLRAWGQGQPLSPVAAPAEALAGATETARRRAQEFWDATALFLAAHGESESGYDRRLPLTAALRSRPAFKEMEMAWENLALALARTEGELERLASALADIPAGEAVDDKARAGRAGEDLLAEASSLLTTGRQLRQAMASVVGSYEPSRICWLSAYQPGRGAASGGLGMTGRGAASGGMGVGGGVGLAAAPLAVGPILNKELWSAKPTAILTSATLTAEGSFTYLQERLGIEDAQGLRLDSPFDYNRSTLVLIPQDMPYPEEGAYPKALAEAIEGLVRASRGRALALFTSHAALRGAYEAAREGLRRDGVRLLAQGIDGSPPKLLEALRREPRTAILGTASFWEGIDVIGEALSLLIMAKLPFSVPSEPVFAARSALLPRPFQEYALPQAVLRFRQGFGRLIRHQDDRGIMVVLDRRLVSRSYGRAFLRSLPSCTVRQAPLAQLPALVGRWLEDGR
ncbi:MAG TPA: helicase C-terminal domain-containing protein, partial [Dehalococcoidia bacterium]|nr:helicase C-terminal domain-containing protein [Dehalococcoidia bacterium]